MTHQAGPVDSDMLSDQDADPEIGPTVIDLGVHRAGNIDEGYYGQLGAKIEYIMQAMFGGRSPNVKIRGTPAEIAAFANVLSQEKNYLQAFQEFGLDNPRTYRSKAVLDNAIKQFTRTTKLPWVFR